MANLNEKNARLASKRRQSNRRRGILAVLGCAVVVVTASVLMMPAISMSKGDLTCGFEEHAHSDACYTQVLTCDLQEAEGHAHTDACYEKVLVCDEEEGDDHVHTDACYEKQLKCGLEESEGHAHSAACYEKQLTCSTPEHTHTDACYTHVQANDEKVVAKAAAEAEKSEATAKSEEPAKAEQSSKAADTAKSSSAATSKSSASASSAAASKDSAKKDEVKMPAVDFEKKIDRTGAPAIKVKVKAPEGAFPEGTTMEAKLIAADDVKTKVEEAIERENGEDAKIKSITAVDIVFKDKDGKEIEPAKAVEVKISSDEVSDIEKPMLVHVLDKSKDSSKDAVYDAEVVSAKVVDDDSTGAEDNTMKFESKAFSPYVIVELEDDDIDPVTGARTINVSNEEAGYSITVNIPAEADIPSGAKLSVEELLQPSRAWTSYVDTLENETGTEIGYARLFDITILDAEDNEVQPQVPVEVQIVLDDAAELNDDVTVAHFVSEDEVEFVDANLSGDTVSFDAEGFSVYAVVGEGDTGAYARMTINFYNGDDLIATMYVKNKDTLDDLNTIIYDPGVGELTGREMFRGWTFNPDYTSDDADSHYDPETDPDGLMTIDDIRVWAEGKTITENETVNIYAMIFTHFAVSYVDLAEYGTGEGDISLGTGSIYLARTETQGAYTVSMPYTPHDAVHNFEGWKVIEGADNIVSATYGGESVDITQPIQNGTKLVIKGDVKLRVNAPKGNWLVFDENAKGATYNAPQFLEPDEEAVMPNPNTMTLTGYDFVGWYYNAEGTGEEFTGGTISERTTVYAKWTPKTIAPYKVLIYQQTADSIGKTELGDEDYTLVASVAVDEGTVGTNIPYTFRNNGDEDYVTVQNSDYHYTGFSLKAEEANKQVQITSDGKAVLELHFDRIKYNLKFYLYRQATNGQRSYATQSAAGRNVWGIAGNWQNVSAGNVPTTTYPGGVQSETVDGYTGYYFTLSAYYEEDISSKWPTYAQIKGPNNDGTKAVSFIMMNGTGLKGNSIDGNGYGDGRDTVKGVITVMDYNILGATNAANGNYLIIRYASYNDWTYHIYYEAYEGQDLTGKTTRVLNGKTYYLDHDVASRSSNTYPAQQNPPQFRGFDVVKNADGSEYYDGYGGNAPYQGNITGYTVYLNYYYDRRVYQVNYHDGVYVDASNNVLESGEGAYLTDSVRAFGKKYAFDSTIPDEARDLDPTSLLDAAHQNEYVFEGWYFDQACGIPYEWGKMPIDGVKVYAKWRQKQYRVFLHPNVPDESKEIDWGSDDQAMNFRRSYDQTVSLPEGLQEGYEMVGWFLDPGCTQLFDESTKVNDGTTSGDYVKNRDWTDPMDQYGNVGDDPYNADEGRFWVQRKLDLYAKWRQVLLGADGINVAYDAGEGSGAPTDSTLYLDSAEVVAQSAPTEPPEGKVFLYWVLQKWDDSANEGAGGFVDVKPLKTAVPGDTFTVLLANAHQEKAPGYTDENPKYTYTVQLRAEYEDAGSHTPTHIDWYKNYGSDNPQSPEYSNTGADGKGLKINEAVEIYTPNDREGYRFIGWARVPNTISGSDQHEGKGNLLDQDTILSNYMYLYYDDGKYYVDAAKETEVSQVAADEDTPYHDMYAMWERVYTVKVDKTVVSGNDDDKQIPFEFSASYTINNEDEETDSFTLKHDGEKEYKDMFPAGSTFSVTETPNEDFDTTVTAVYTDDQGTEHTIAVGEDPIEIQGDTVITVTNTSKKKIVRVYKVDDSASPNPLASVEFTINNQKLTTGNDGYTDTIELQGGFYTLTESQALVAYAGLSDPVAVSVSATGVTVNPAEADAAKVSITGPDSQGVYTIKVINTKKVVPIKIVKVDQTGKPLAGATFTSDLYSGSKTSTVVGDEAVIYQDNKVSLGNYTMTETEPPAGYNPVNTVKIAVSSEAGSSNIAVTAENATVDPIDIDKPELGYKVTIQNSNGQSLPNTGGTGTIPFTLGGIALIAIAACMYGFGSRRNRERGSRG